jgi:hypothetical protein
MTPELATPHPEPESNPVNSDLDLIALQRDGKDALAPQGVDKVVNIALCKVTYASTDPTHEVTTREADDLFASSALDPKHVPPFPTDAVPLAATLAFNFTDSPGAETVELRSHHKLQLKNTGHLTPILAWLAKCGLRVSRTLARRATLIALAILAAIAPALDDDDDDDGNDDDPADPIQQNK